MDVPPDNKPFEDHRPTQPHFLSMENAMEGDKIKIASNDTVNGIKDLGQISSMQFPQGFVTGEEENNTAGNNYFKEFHLGIDPDVKIYFEYRGSRISKATAEKFQKILANNTSKLTPDELRDVGEILDSKSIPEDFHIQIAKTQKVDGKSILVVEGRYIQHDLQARTFYVDADGSGRVIQEVTFQTPMAKRSKYFPDGIKALESIKWK